MDERPIVQELSIPLYQAKGWMKLLGVMNILHGIAAALTIVGIVFAWLPIWLGVLLFKSASMVEGAQLSGDKVHLLEGMRKLKTYFVINGVMMLVVLIFIGLTILMFGAAIIAAVSESGGFRGW